MSNSEKIVYVTGAGRGIGKAISKKLVADGYMVSGCARSEAELAKTREELGKMFHYEVVDVRDESALTTWMNEQEEHGRDRHGASPWGLVTAAGIYGPIGNFMENNWQQWKDGVDINLYGTVLACRIFAKKMISQKKPGRIVLMSGGGATQPLPNFTNYCATKAAVVRFGETIAHELKPYQLTVNAIAPGAVNTRLTEDLIKAGPEKAGKEMYEKALKQREEGGTSPDKAADLAAYLLSDISAPVTGKLISAVWDPWNELHTLGENFSKGDTYTLRRVTPK